MNTKAHLTITAFGRLEVVLRGREPAEPSPQEQAGIKEIRYVHPPETASISLDFLVEEEAANYVVPHVTA